MEGELEKLDENLGGVADMKRQPDAVFIIDLRKEQLAVREARRLGLPIVALVDTNCDPDEADYVIPGNDDAIRACDLIVRVIADGIEAGRQHATSADFQAAPEAEAPEEPEAEIPTTPEGDYEQVAPGEEPVVHEHLAVDAGDARLLHLPGQRLDPGERVGVGQLGVHQPAVGVGVVVVAEGGPAVLGGAPTEGEVAGGDERFDVTLE